MIRQELYEKWQQALWGQEEVSSSVRVFAVLDGARDAQIVEMLRSCNQHFVSLFAGDMSEQLFTAAPQVVKLSQQSEFTEKLFMKAWGNSWGVFVSANKPTGIEDIRKQLRKFLLVQGPDGQKRFFRYYDPRVLRVYLPTCNEQELQVLFNPIHRYVMEDETGTGLLSFDRQSLNHSWHQ